jgi:hypothetical protein
MRAYDDSGEIIDVAHHCKDFKASGTAESRKNSSEISISCLTCSNWYTDGCISESYEGALKCMEKNQ